MFFYNKGLAYFRHWI